MKNSIIVDGVTYYREQPELTKAKVAIEKYEWLTASIRHVLEAAQGLYDNMKEEGLNFSSIEAEGYLRCAKQLSNEIAAIEDNY